MESHRKRERTGLIGLGLLGSAIAGRLLESQVPVLGFDIVSDRRLELKSAGGQFTESIPNVLKVCDIILLSLPTSDVVYNLLMEAEAQLRKGQIFIDTTTGHPDVMEEIGHRLKSRGVDYIEATVAGSSEQMRLGFATLFVGGEKSVIDTVIPLLRTLTQKYFHLGNVGSASRFKLVHNLVLGLNRAVLAEGLAFAEGLGFDARVVLEILKQTPASSSVMQTKGEKMVHRDWRPEARLAQHQKDVQLIVDFASKVQTPTPLSEVHLKLLTQAVELGYADLDNSAILEVFRSPPA